MLASSAKRRQWRATLDQILSVPALLVGEVADAHQVGVLVLLDLAEAPADAPPGGVAEGPRQQDVAPCLAGALVADAGVGARQAGDEGVQVARGLGEPLL